MEELTKDIWIATSAIKLGRFTYQLMTNSQANGASKTTTMEKKLMANTIIVMMLKMDSIKWLGPTELLLKQIMLMACRMVSASCFSPMEELSKVL